MKDAIDIFASRGNSLFVLQIPTYNLDASLIERSVPAATEHSHVVPCGSQLLDDV